MTGPYARSAFSSADELRHHCNAKIGDRTADFQRCLWYIAAIHDLMQDAGPIKGGRACFPDTLIVGNLVRPVVEYIDRLPNPKRLGAGGTVMAALMAAFPCPDQPRTADTEKSAVEMRQLRPNMADYVGKVISTSGFIKCLVTIDDCTVEPEPFSSGLMPDLYFDAKALDTSVRSDFYAKCQSICFFD